MRYSATSSRRDLIVEYTYQAGEKRHEGRRVALYTIAHQAEAEKLAGKFPVEAEVPVY